MCFESCVHISNVQKRRFLGNARLRASPGVERTRYFSASSYTVVVLPSLARCAAWDNKTLCRRFYASLCDKIIMPKPDSLLSLWRQRFLLLKLMLLVKRNLHQLGSYKDGKLSSIFFNYYTVYFFF